MYSHIIVSVDLSDRNAPALRVASEIAREHGASVTLLHVVETIEGPPQEEMEDFYAKLSAKAEQQLGSWAKEFEKHRVSVEVSVLRGKRAQTIVRYADDQRGDLIVLNTHRVDPENPGGALGSISHRVALLAGCSVLLVRG